MPSWFLWFAVLFLALVFPAIAPADPGSIKIQSPAEGQVVAEPSVTLRYQFIRGDQGDHLHFYVDGRLYKTTKRDSAVLWDLPPGMHTIEARVASRERDATGYEHKELGPKDAVTIRIESQALTQGRDARR